MKTLSKVALASLFLAAVPQVACKPAPPKTPGGAAAAGPGSGPAPAPLVGHNLVYNGDFAKGARSLPWNGELSKPAQGRTFVDKGELCLEVKNRGPTAGTRSFATSTSSWRRGTPTPSSSRCGRRRRRALT